MDKRKINKEIYAAFKKVNQEISDLASHGHIAAGLSSEGYSGGYRDCLTDIQLLLNGIMPKRRNYWDQQEESNESG